MKKKCSDQDESWRATTNVSCMYSEYMAHRALSRNCCALVYALENDLNNVLENVLDKVLNDDLNVVLNNALDIDPFIT